MEFDAVAQAVSGVPYLSPSEGRIIFEHVSDTRPMVALELGTAHGVGAAYIAAALPPGGRLITVDHAEASFEPSPAEVLERAGVGDRVEIVREYSSYTWWLKSELERAHRSGPRIDFAFLDGAKNWTIDGLAVLLLERVIRPGGWLLVDDLEWTYDNREVSDVVSLRSFSDSERAQPHLRAVFDLLIAGNPAWTDLKLQDDWWGWARKRRADEAIGPQTVQVEMSRSVGAIAGAGVRRAIRTVKRQAQMRSRARSS